MIGRLFIVENHVAARDQSGINDADAVYEVEVESGITRLAAVKLCQQNTGPTGPIRSVRMPLIDVATEFDDTPLFAHFGGSGHVDDEPSLTNALRQVSDLGWTGHNAVDGRFAPASLISRLPNRIPGTAIEHTAYADQDAIREAARQKGLSNLDTRTGKAWDEDFRRYRYKTDAPPEARPASQHVFIPFKGERHIDTVTWDYDPVSNHYFRSNGGVPHLDKNTGDQISTKNVIIKFMDVTRNVNGEYTHYEPLGTGIATILQDGQRIDGIWERTDKMARTIYKDAAGNEVIFNEGRYWVSQVAADTAVEITP